MGWNLETDAWRRVCVFLAPAAIPWVPQQRASRLAIRVAMASAQLLASATVGRRVSDSLWEPGRKGTLERDARILERDGSADRTDRKDGSELGVERCGVRCAGGTACQAGGKRVPGYPERSRDQTMACAREGLGALAWILADWMGWMPGPAPDCRTRRENGRGLEDKTPRGFKHCLPRISLPEDL